MIQGVINSLKTTICVVFVSTLASCGGAPGSSGSLLTEEAESTPTIAFSSATSTELVLLEQGGVQDSVVTFVVTNAAGDALEGVLVNFALNTQVGGIEFSPSFAVSDSSGLVSMSIKSGSFPTTVSVLATIDQTTTRAISSEISISTSVFSADSFRLSPVLSDVVTDAGIYEAGVRGGIQVTLQIIATDVFGHQVIDGLSATIVSPETGLVTPSECEMSGGICTVTWTSSEGGREFSTVKVLAYAQGSESFSDVNGNNVYELGEAFVDLGEAYLDANDNGAYDLGEFFFDSDDNGVYDAVGNGVWDGACGTLLGESAADRSARCSGLPSTTISDTADLNFLGETPEE